LLGSHGPFLRKSAVQREVCQRLEEQVERLKRDHAEKLELLTKNRLASLLDYRRFHEDEHEARRLLKSANRQLHDHKQSHPTNLNGPVTQE
jgi:hypothetical protein